jgi:uncharacterized phosphosugar-binding protein
VASTESLPSGEVFADYVSGIVQEVVEANAAAVQEAASLVFARIVTGGVVQAFGTGHSLAAALELAGRAGGLVPTNRLSLSDLVLYGKDDASILDDPLLEREAGIAQRLFELAAPADADMFVIFSNSGVNASVIDMAQLVKERGLPLVVVTSVVGSRAVPSRHASGTRLLDHADVVLDNGAPVGDAVLDIGEGRRVCAVSSITTSLLVQMLVAETAARFLRAGRPVPAYVSANVPGGHEANLLLESDYDGRIRRGAV